LRQFLIVEISENNIRSLSVLLSSGITIRFGSKNINDKMKIFFKSYKKILNTSDLKKIRYIDMRYSNGFSIGWKQNICVI
jgi:cell division septal protein FtsQ